MVRSEDVLSIYQRLGAAGIPVWLTGGWGIDALLGEQTRPHKDLDILLQLDDVVRMSELLSRAGFGLKGLWSENSWAVDAQGIKTPTAFVLQDAAGREIDAHALRFDARGNGIPAWANDEGLIFREADLAGAGLVAGVAVRCLTSEMQMVCHTGYALPDAQLHDLALLGKRFGVQQPTTSHPSEPAQLHSKDTARQRSDSPHCPQP